MKTAFLHLAIAVIWLFLSPTRDLPRLLIGFLIGWVLIAAFRPILPKDRYQQGLTGFFRWCWAFFKALVLSQIRVSQIILFPSRNPISPGFVEFPLGDLTEMEIMLLSHSVTLTPGTASVDVYPEKRILLIHALEAGCPEATIQEIRESLLKPLLALTRP